MEGRMLSRRAMEIVMSSLIMILTAGMIWLTPHLIMELHLGQTNIPFKATTFPYYLLFGILVLSGIWLVRILLGKSPDVVEAPFVFDKSKLRIVITFFIIFLGTCAISLIGFNVVIALMTGSLMLYFGVRNWRTTLIVSVMNSVFVYCFFEVILLIPLPKGLLFD
jgi:hypothetical protein